MQTNKQLFVPKVFIIGLGYLGLSLATLLTKQHKSFSGTVTSLEKQQQLLAQSIQSHYFNLYEGTVTLQANPFVESIVSTKNWENTSLVLAIPPGRNNFRPEEYSKRMCSLIDCFMRRGLRSLIFISTSAVYGSATGIVNNKTAVSPETPSAIAHVNIEQHISAHYYEKSVILRLSGLVGPKPDGSLRHPIFTLSKKKDIDKGKDPVNLIHQQDAVEVIATLLEHTKPPFHTAVLSSLEQVNRQDYYTWSANVLNLPAPTFLSDTAPRAFSKWIDASDTFKKLNMSPRYKSPFDMLEGYI